MMRTPNGNTATDVTRERCEQLAKDPAHLQRLIDFWPPENMMHILAREQLARINEQNRATKPTNAAIANALETLLWPNMSIGNKMVILAAINALRGRKDENS